MIKLFILLSALTSFAFADVTIESRNGVTAPHSEGRPIARYLSENEFTFSYDKVDFIVTGNIYGAQNWRKRVRNEDGMFKVDAVRYQYGAEIKYNFNDNWSLYTRHITPHDRHDKTVGDGWNDTSYRWDSGFIYKRTFGK